MRRALWFAAFFLCFSLVTVPAAWAYIDLPSGSALFQILIAGLLGVGVAFRSFWRRVWSAITGRRDRDAGDG
jgi:hypothetical protein